MVSDIQGPGLHSERSSAKLPSKTSRCAWHAKCHPMNSMILLVDGRVQRGCFPPERRSPSDLGLTVSQHPAWGLPTMFLQTGSIHQCHNTCRVPPLVQDWRVCVFLSMVVKCGETGRMYFFCQPPHHLNMSQQQAICFTEGAARRRRGLRSLGWLSVAALLCCALVCLAPPLWSVGPLFAISAVLACSFAWLTG